MCVGGGGVERVGVGLMLVRVYVDKHETGYSACSYIYFPFFLLSDVHTSVAQKYQHVLGFVTDDIPSCLLVINRKMS